MSPDQLLTLCHDYAKSKLSLDELKAAVWSTAATLTSPQERELREFLQRAAGQLDTIQFTVEEDTIQFTVEEVRQSALEVVEAIEAQLASRFSNS